MQVGILEPKMVPGQKPGASIARWVEAQKAGKLGQPTESGATTSQQEQPQRPVEIS